MAVLISICAVIFWLWAVATCCATAEARELIFSQEPILSGKLCVPEGRGPFPVAVFNHGGEGYREKNRLQSIVGDRIRICKALAEAGIVGFSPIRRPTAKMNVHVQDITNALEALKKLSFVDSKKIALIGFSSGGLVSMLTAIRHPDLKALVVMAGAAGHAGNAGMNKFARIRAPILLLVAENDTGSKYTKGTDVVAGMRHIHTKLKEMGKDSTLIVYPPYGSDGHSKFWEMGDYWKDVQSFLDLHLNTDVSVPSVNVHQAGPSPQKVLNRMDQDGNGRISQEEWLGPAPAFGRIDANGDGLLDFVELQNWFKIHR